MKQLLILSLAIATSAFSADSFRHNLACVGEGEGKKIEGTIRISYDGETKEPEFAVLKLSITESFQGDGREMIPSTIDLPEARVDPNAIYSHDVEGDGQPYDDQMHETWYSLPHNTGYLEHTFQTAIDDQGRTVIVMSDLRYATQVRSEEAIPLSCREFSRQIR